MKKDFIKNNKGITLIALVITIVILIILAAVAINLAIGENGIISRAKQAALMQKKAQYTEEISLAIIEEQTERQIKASEEAFIVSINERLTGQKQASNESVSLYTKKPWIESTIMCDEEKEIHSNPFDNNRLYIYTTLGYELVLAVDNQTLNASVLEESFQKISDIANVTYNANDGTGNVEGQSISPGFKVTLRENGFTKNHYTFAGWCKNQDGSGEKYQPGSQIVITEDTVLYAVWSLNTVTVAFNNNTGLGEMASRDIVIDEVTKLPKNSFTKIGYEFNKWTTNPDGTGDEYLDEANITIDSDTTLYANWILKNYAITYALDGGSISGEKTSYTMNDESFTLPTPTKDGYVFTGWSGTGLSEATLSVTVVSGSTGPRAYTANYREKIITYYEVPQITSASNTQAFASGSFTNYKPYLAFDRNIRNGTVESGYLDSPWAITGTGNAYVGYDFVINVEVYRAEYTPRYDINGNNDCRNQNLQQYKYQYSDDFTTWYDATETITTNSKVINDPISTNINAGSHRYWRIYAISNYGSTHTAVNELQFYGKTET